VTVLDDGQWIEIAGTMNVPDCKLTKLEFYAEGGTGADLYVDDVRVIDVSLSNLIPDGTFESGLGSWWGWGNTSLSVIEGYAHSGTHSLVSANRTGNGTMVRTIASMVSPGKRYQVSFWVSVSGQASGSAQVNVVRHVPPCITYQWLGPITVSNGQWAISPVCWISGAAPA